MRLIHDIFFMEASSTVHLPTNEATHINIKINAMFLICANRIIEWRMEMEAESSEEKEFIGNKKYKEIKYISLLTIRISTNYSSILHDVYLFFRMFVVI